MSEADSVATASRRLTVALDALEAAVERRRDADRSATATAAQIHALGDDRARLAGDLDHALARARVLEAANKEVAERMAQAIETIRGVLAETEDKE